MKKIIIALMLCFALVMTVLTSCGGDEKKPVEENVAETGVETAPENESEETVGVEAETDEKAGEETSEDNTEEIAEENTEEKVDTPVEEPKLSEDIAVDPEKAEEVVNTLEFENVNLLSGIANAMGKATSEVTQEDIEAIYYFSIGKENTGDYTVYIGMQDYKNAVDEGLDVSQEQSFFKKSVITIDAESESLSDISKFKNLELFEIYNVPVTDVSFIKELSNLESGFLRDNGITDVSALEGYDTDKLKLLDFTENSISDWTPLYHIKEKVVVDNGCRFMTDENNLPVYVQVSQPIYLADKVAMDEAKNEAPAEETDNTIQFVGPNGESGLESLFE